MQAVVFDQFGPPEVLQLRAVPTPQPGPGEALIKVRACGVNNLDLQLRAGHFRHRLTLPHIIGSEATGEVVELGPNATGWQVGDRVAVSPWVGCNQCEFCLVGEETTCVRPRFVGIARPGAYAEYLVVSAYQLVAIPLALSFEDAAAMTLATLTAWHMLVRRAQIRAGEQVLVLAAGSGVGSAAVQIANLFGCRIIATAGSDDKLARAKELGADEVINHYQQDFQAEVMRLTANRGVDVVVEHVGQATWAKSIASLTFNGRLVTCGTTTGAEGQLNLEQLFVKQIGVLGSRGGTRAELHQVLNLTASGHLRPVIDRVYPLAETTEAHRRLAAREQFGKILLAV